MKNNWAVFAAILFFLYVLRTTRAMIDYALWSLAFVDVFTPVATACFLGMCALILDTRVSIKLEYVRLLCLGALQFVAAFVLQSAVLFEGIRGFLDAVCFFSVEIFGRVSEGIIFLTMLLGAVLLATYASRLSEHELREKTRRITSCLIYLWLLYAGAVIVEYVSMPVTYFGPVIAVWITAFLALVALMLNVKAETHIIFFFRVSIVQVIGMGICMFLLAGPYAGNLLYNVNSILLRIFT